MSDLDELAKRVEQVVDMDPEAQNELVDEIQVQINALQGAMDNIGTDYNVKTTTDEYIGGVEDVGKNALNIIKLRKLLNKITQE